MKNTELLPFERNRYYTGKMLTSADFLAEQTYNNNKRRFINQSMFGPGIVCGCGVFGLDDLSILVESGTAIDSLGREIVIESSAVKKLSAISGFDELTENVASLCLRYKEDDVHAVYTVSHQDSDSEYEYNRVAEGYELFLTDRSLASEEMSIDTEFYAQATLLDNPDYTVVIKMPATVSVGRYAKILIEVTKNSAKVAGLDYACTLQFPGFTAEDGSHELNVELSNIMLDENEKTKKEYWIKAQDQVITDISVVLKNQSARALVGGNSVEAAGNISLQIALSERTPDEIALWENNKLSLEMRSAGNFRDYIRLADIYLVRTETAYIIEKIEEKSVKKYIPTIAGARNQSEFLSFYRESASAIQVNGTVDSTVADGTFKEHLGKIPEIETGILEVPIKANAKKGDICYSGEIMHGLGKGNVYVDIGYEKITSDANNETGAKTTVYGNPDLFKTDDKEEIAVETAVKVLNDKGSFMVAVKFLKDVDYLVLTFRWVAIKFPTVDEVDLLDNNENMSISVETPTIVLGTQESYYFNVKFNNMQTCSLAYELTEAGGGSISGDGVYTAPAKEGVYEIRIYCVEKPVICTYAYAIVKRKAGSEA